MRPALFPIAILILNVLVFFGTVHGQTSMEDLTPEQQVLYNEHMVWGQPDTNGVLVRTAYVASYNHAFRIPNWCAYHVIADYMNTPTREGDFDEFHDDPDVVNPVTDDDYDGVFTDVGYDRGHYAPYNILGGDRDGDGVLANLEDRPNSDPDEERTIFEGNFMSNIAPQLAHGLNRHGLWRNTESWIQETVVDTSDREVWVYSGGLIVDDRSMEFIGPDNDIAVPDMFYKVVIKHGEDELPDVLAFLFPHYDHKDDINEKNIFHYLVSIDYLEAIGNLDFLNTLTKEQQDSVEKFVNLSGWEEFMN